MNVHADFVSIFSGQWPVLKLLPLHLAVMLVHLLPYLEQITASLAKTSECMSILTGVPVRLKRGDKCVTEAPPGLVPRLGRCLLGDTMVAGNRFADGTYRLLLEIGPLSARKMETFFPGAANNRILNASWSCSCHRTRRYKSAISSNRRTPVSGWGHRTDSARTWESVLIYKETKHHPT